MEAPRAALSGAQSSQALDGLQVPTCRAQECRKALWHMELLLAHEPPKPSLMSDIPLRKSQGVQDAPWTLRVKPESPQFSEALSVPKGFPLLVDGEVGEIGRGLA